MLCKLFEEFVHNEIDDEGLMYTADVPLIALPLTLMECSNLT